VTQRKYILEIRNYVLKPNNRDEFTHLFQTQSRPMLERWKIQVLAFGISLGDANGAYLMRTFDSLEAREKIESEFYGSDEWHKGPRAATLACIESYADAVLEVDAFFIDAIRNV
jgi:NIPSNAP